MTGAAVRAVRWREPRRTWIDLARSWVFEAFVFLGLSIYSAAFAPALRYARGEAQLKPGETEITNTIFQFVILISMTVYFIRNRSRIVPLARPLWLYLVIIGVCILSTAWSPYPFDTIRRCVTLSTCIAFGVFLYLELGLDGILRRYAVTAFILAFLSLFVWVFVPAIGRDTLLGYEGALRGIFSAKNSCGETVLLAISAYVYIAVRERRLVKPAIALVLLIACMVLVRSATSAIIALVLLAVGTLTYTARSRFFIVLVYGVFVVTAVAIFVLVFDPDLVFKASGRDASLTGRVPLWYYSIQAALERPWLGYGYSGFWKEDSRLVQYIWIAVDWNPPSAHNGYIDIALQLGVLGLGLYVVLWYKVIYDAIAGWRSGTMPEAFWIVLFMIINLLLNMDEGPLPYPDQFTAMMPATIIALYAWRVRQRQATLSARSAGPGRRRTPPRRGPVPIAGDGTRLA